jgi:hypothetical protein
VPTPHFEHVIIPSTLAPKNDISKKYKVPVIGQLAVLELDWCDFVIWTRKGMAVQRILFNQPFWESQDDV